MSVWHYILCTAGHVDHGKSALVRALSGADPDRLPEEKARGITIELGFAHLDLPSPRDRQTLRIGIVDVPGHEDFVTNMVAGVGSIDLALLVVAADDGWMPQSEEHLQILTYLGVKSGVVALNKIDLAASEADARENIRQHLKGSPLADAPIIPTSTVSGRGIEELKSVVAWQLAQVEPQKDFGKPRLSVDRAFAMRGAGTIVTGTLTGGVLSTGQSVSIHPSGKISRIRSLQSYNTVVRQAVPGSRVALNLPDLQLASSSHSGDVSRGDVITLPNLGRASDTLDAVLEVTPRANHARPLKQATPVRVHHGSANIPASIYFHGAPTLGAGEKALAQLRLQSPLFAFAGDRFVVRDWSGQQTLAGGVVLDADALRRGFRTEQRRWFLQARADHPTSAEAFVSSQLFRAGTAAKSGLLLKSKFSQQQVIDGVEALVRQGKVFVERDLVADIGWWRQAQRRAMEMIDAAHRSFPQEIGLRLTDLRQSLGREFSANEIFDALIAQLCHSGCVRSGAVIRRQTHRPALPAHLQAAGQKLRSILENKSLEPPSRKELAPDSASQQALRFLLQNGEAVEVGDELVLSAPHYQDAIERIRTLLSQSGGSTVSELRQALGTSRRIMVPLLEKLDQDGITMRQGDKRVLRTTTAVS